MEKHIQKILKYLGSIEVGILLFVILVNPYGGRIIAVLSVIIFEAAKYVRPIECRIKKDLRGKVAVITGGNTGIGKETALELARQGCIVVIGARDVKKSIQAIEEIRKETKNDNVFQISLDLGSKESINEFSDQIHSRFKEVHYLVNNAGVSMIPQRTLTKDGFEMQIGINHFGHFYLTYKLWDVLTIVPDVRIVNISSYAHTGITRNLDLDFDNLNFQKGDYKAAISYYRSKLANVLFAQQLAKRLQKSHPNARCISLHPGTVRTQLGREALKQKQWLKILVFFVTLLIMRTPKQGAQTSLFTILTDSQNLINGQYYQNSAISKRNPFTNNPINQQKLWQISQQSYGITFNAN